MTGTGSVERPDRDFDVVLVLSGGNALGAFRAGVYEALHTHGLQPDWVVGASIGAINGALIAGSPPEARINALRSFWRPHVIGPMDLAHPWLSPSLETSRRSAAAMWTAVAGRAGIFGPALSALTPWADDRPSVFETEQLAATLGNAIDFVRLNDGSCRFTATAVDLETGEDVVFDSDKHVIRPHHIRASAALPVLFPPVEIDGRWFVDGGLSANLPLDPVLSAPPCRPTLCIAVDLLPLDGRRPTTLGEAAGRMQDLIFAAQSRRSIARWREEYEGRKDRAISLVRLAYTHGAGSSERRPGTSPRVSQAAVTSDQVSVALVTGNGDDVVGDAADLASRTAPGPVGLAGNWVCRSDLTSVGSTKIHRVDRTGYRDPTSPAFQRQIPCSAV